MNLDWCRHSDWVDDYLSSEVEGKKPSHHDMDDNNISTPPNGLHYFSKWLNLDVVKHCYSGTWRFLFWRKAGPKGISANLPSLLGVVADAHSHTVPQLQTPRGCDRYKISVSLEAENVSNTFDYTE